MDKEYVRNIAATVCKFLEETPLVGKGVPVYSEVWNFLQALGVGEISVIATPTLTELQGQELELARFRKAAARWKSIQARYEQVIAEEVPDADAKKG